MTDSLSAPIWTERSGRRGAEVENLKAVQYFTTEGGRFSFATGRTVGFIRDRFLSVINAPACLLNGGVVYEYKNDRVLYERRVAFTVREFLEVVRPEVGSGTTLHVNHDTFAESTVYRNFDAVGSEELDLHATKLICVFETPEKALEFKKFALSQDFFKDTYISRSWNVGVEFNACNGTKGHALDFIKAQLKNIHTSVGIGDYENDITLIRHADIGAAVGSGTEELKQCADWIVKPCSQFAVKDLIERLEALV